VWGEEVNMPGLLLKDVEMIWWEKPKSQFVTLSLKKAPNMLFNSEDSGHQLSRVAKGSGYCYTDLGRELRISLPCH